MSTSEEIPEKMKAFVLTGHGNLDKLVFKEDWPVPKLNDDDVLIKVEACGLNNTDVNTRSGWYSKSVTDATTGDAYEKVESDPTWGGSPIKFPRIQGADVCGTIVEVGKNTPSNLIGKRVITDNWLRDWNEPDNKDKCRYYGSEHDGGFAEYTSIDRRNVGVVESSLSSEELATFSCSYTTAEGMLSRANVNDSDWVLITGASGGVGSALVQLAKRRGAKVAAMASESKHDAILALGADAVLPRNPKNLADSLSTSIGRNQVSVVTDIVGGPGFPNYIDVLERGGRYTCSGAIAGPIVELDLRTFYLNDLTFTGSTIVPVGIFSDIVKFIENGEIKPLLAATYPLEQLKIAQQAFIDKKHTGNIAVTVS